MKNKIGYYRALGTCVSIFLCSASFMVLIVFGLLKLFGVL